MQNLSLTLQNPKVTAIPNYFLDTYMPEANGEFVKVYLYLLRSVSDSSLPISVSVLADKLNHTEKDILRALRYWEKEGLLSLTYNSSKELTGILLSDLAFGSSVSSVLKADKVVSEDEASLGGDARLTAPDKTAYSKSDIDILTKSEDFKTLLYIAQRYIGKTLSSSDTDTLIYIYCTLKFPLELTEYLIEQCVSAGHRNLGYIEKVALSWAERGIKTVDEAKTCSAFYGKTCYAVLKAFGLSRRNPVDSEVATIEKWTGKYCFTEDIILEACNRTMQTIHQPSFEYADSILNKWFTAGVKHLSDIAALDDNHKRSRSSGASKADEARPVSNKFNNMVSRSYVYDDLEKKLLNR